MMLKPDYKSARRGGGEEEDGVYGESNMETYMLKKNLSFFLLACPRCLQDLSSPIWGGTRKKKKKKEKSAENPIRIKE